MSQASGLKPLEVTELERKFIFMLNRPYQTETNKMHPKKSGPKLIFGTVIKPIDFSNISLNQPNLS